MKFFNLLISSTFFMAVAFSVVAMTVTTFMRYTDHMNANQWLASLETTALLCAAVVGKRAIDGVTKAIRTKKGANDD